MQMDNAFSVTGKLSPSLKITDGLMSVAIGVVHVKQLGRDCITLGSP